MAGEAGEVGVTPERGGGGGEEEGPLDGRGPPGLLLDYQDPTG